ncbi:MAG: ABC transporter ATP-binding protein [Chloroflexota bacterium]
MLEVINLTKTYSGNLHALRGVTLTIESVGMFGLLGPNGAGKTTLMRILAGLLTPSDGLISIFGHNIATPAGRKALQAQLGYLPQELALYPNFTAYEFLDYMAITKGVNNRKARQQQIAELLDIVRLSDVAKRPMRTYSGGMKRRVGIAQAMLGSPRLIIVDEPTVGLDPEERVRFRHLLASAAEQCIVILSTHIIEDIGQSCKELAIIQKGTVRFSGSPQALIEQSRIKAQNQTLNLEQSYIVATNDGQDISMI